MRKLLIWLVLVGSCGCMQNSQPIENSTKNVVVTQASKDVVEALKDKSKDDCLEVYYMLSGLRLYVEKYDGVTSSTQALKLFREVRNRLKVDMSKYSKLDDIVEKRLVSDGFDIPKKLDEETRQKFVKAFEELEIGALNAYKLR